MGRPAHYKTKQREAILSYVASLGEAAVTAGEIAEYFKGAGAPIALTTVYRHLEKLEGEGALCRSLLDATLGARYSYVGGQGAHDRFYLKCEGCGGFERLNCGEMASLRKHISDEHDFQISPAKTVLYGKCKSCACDACGKDGGLI